MPETTVKLSGVRKTFGPTVALGGANLTAYAGEVHAIIGGNGSGKSTLAKVISGVLIPDAGQVSILGKAATSPVEARRLGIANVFQEVLVADACSVLDNLYLGADGLFGGSLSRAEKERRAGILMAELTGQEVDLAAPVGELPLSLKQWVTIGRALLAEPKVLILDESSAALDFESTERLFAKMRELKGRGATILIVTHRIAELVRIADRATVLRDGVDVGRLAKDEMSEAAIFALIAGPGRETAARTGEGADRTSPLPVLRVEDAQVWPASHPFDFALHPGEIVGVTGLDGQGQADFVRALAGVQALVAGRIAVVRDGRAHAIDGLAAARANAVSYVSGDRKKEGIFANLSIFENLLLPVHRDYRLGGALGIIDRQKLAPVFEWEAQKLSVRMGSREDAITSLSGGNQQKVLIGRAFAEKPKVLVLNDPARGIDVAAKRDLYRNLKDFSAQGGAVVFLSSEVEEFLDLCTEVVVFRNGAISTRFAPPYDGHAILNAMFGRRLDAALPGEAGAAPSHDAAAWAGRDARRFRPRLEGGRPVARPVAARSANPPPARHPPFALSSPDIAPGENIPRRFVEDSRISPRLVWTDPPEGTRSFALSVTDPDLPQAFGFGRAFAHWLVVDIPAEVRALPEGASGTAAMGGARELASDFVTFGIPGFGAHWGGPWPPDRAHRYVFTLYALTAERVTLAPDADFPAFCAAVLPVAIDAASFVGRYGPAQKPLPEPTAREEAQ